jgi:hypothetical protein
VYNNIFIDASWGSNKNKKWIVVDYYDPTTEKGEN